MWNVSFEAVYSGILPFLTMYFFRVPYFDSYITTDNSPSVSYA
jgi:hypothetical protein